MKDSLQSRGCAQQRRRRGRLVYWQKFDPDQFEFEFDEDELAGHDVSMDEAIEVFLSRFDVNATSVIMAAINLSAAPTAGGG